MPRRSATADVAAPPKPKKKRNKRPLPPRQPDDLHTRETFCAANRISKSFYFALKREGRGPREIKLGKRILITPGAEADWRAEREAETLAKRQPIAETATTATTAAAT